eukprot:GILJ01005357.1.p1 GENE.GILJ01005357.1~~GILJ01005357.1.p1  ORF type:complete len:827 (+),score=135.00 GILJ01005357.1:373-2481(+)
MANSFDTPCWRSLQQDEVAALCGNDVDVSDVLAAALAPGDGTVNPLLVTKRLLELASSVQVLENCEVVGMEVQQGAVKTVRTTQGDLPCDVVINCDRVAPDAIARLANVTLPTVPVEHLFAVTQPTEKCSKMPALIDHDQSLYIHRSSSNSKGAGLMIGGYDSNPVVYTAATLPNFLNDTYKPLSGTVPQRFESIRQAALKRMPWLTDMSVVLGSTLQQHTPDGSYLVGEVPEVKNFFVATGFNSSEVAFAGGAANALAEWIRDKLAPMDLWACDPRRFHISCTSNKEWVQTRGLDAYRLRYAVGYPNVEPSSGPVIRTSPLYEKLKQNGAVWGTKAGWARPNLYNPPNDVPFEHITTRSGVAVFDQSSFAKFMLEGPDAEKVMSYLCSNDVTKIGGTVYTQMLNKRGGIEADLSVNRISENQYYIVTGTAFGTHDWHWIQHNIPAGSNVKMTDITYEYSTIAVMGPHSRALLNKIVNKEDDISNTGLPYMNHKVIHIANSDIIALRMTFVGELGYELHVPWKDAPRVYDAICEAGKEFKLINAGYKAIDSLHYEKAYRVWTYDLTPDHTPLEAGMPWAVKFKSNTPFLGRERLEEQRKHGLRRKFVTLSLNDDNNGVGLNGWETIYRDGKKAGYLTLAGYGHFVKKHIGVGYVSMQQEESGVMDKGYLERGSYEVEVAGERRPATLHMLPLYDPANEKVRS